MSDQKSGTVFSPCPLPIRYLLSVVGMARCAVSAAWSGARLRAKCRLTARHLPPAITRAGTSQRDVPTTLIAYCIGWGEGGLRPGEGWLGKICAAGDDFGSALLGFEGHA